MARVKFGVGKSGIEEEYGTVVDTSSDRPVIEIAPEEIRLDSQGGYRRAFNPSDRTRVCVTIEATSLGLVRLLDIPIIEAPPVSRTFWFAGFPTGDAIKFEGILYGREMTPSGLRLFFESPTIFTVIDWRYGHDEIGTSGPRAAPDLATLPVANVKPYAGEAPHPLAVRRMAQKLYDDFSAIPLAQSHPPGAPIALSFADCMALSEWFLRQAAPDGMTLDILAEMVAERDLDTEAMGGIYDILSHLLSLLGEKGGE